jgi:RNA polymerase sigma-70 factor (ECF subfamily)
MTGQESDWLIVERVQAGDKQAFNLLVTKYQLRLFRHISRLIRNPEEAEDSVQEAFLKAYRALPGFRRESAFYTWLYRIGINVAKTALSDRLAAKDTVSIEHDADTGSAGVVLVDSTSPESILAMEQVAARINEAMDKLPEMLRIALALRELDGLSYGEISEIMACPIGTTRSRIFRAREFIAQRLDAVLEEPGRLWCGSCDDSPRPALPS